MANEPTILNDRLWEAWRALKPSRPSSPVMPQSITGQLLNSDHSPASNVLVTIRRPDYSNAEPSNFAPMSDVPWPKPSTLTNDSGGFVLALPAFPVPDRMIFDVIASGQQIVSFSVCGREFLDGILGPIVLSAQLKSFSPEIARDFRSSGALSMFDQFHHAIESGSDSKVIRIGESSCAEQYYSQTGPLEEFPFGILFRIVEPNLVSLDASVPEKAPALSTGTLGGSSTPTIAAGGAPPPAASVPLPAAPVPLAAGGAPQVVGSAPPAATVTNPNSAFLNGLVSSALALIPAGKLIESMDPAIIKEVVGGLLALGTVSVDKLRGTIAGIHLASPSLKIIPSNRAAIQAPVNISLFKKQISGWPGLDANLQIPGTLGIGYMLECKQVWRQGGLALGDLLYSLPLAPNEEQLVAVREMQESSRTVDQEAFNASETQQYSSLDNSSSSAVFGAAFNEAANQNSQYAGKSATSGSGSSGGISFPFLGGGGTSTSSSETNTSGSFSAAQNLNRNYASAAAQTLSSGVSRAASAVRSSNRTVVTLATKDSRQSVATKSIKNNNHCHALTVQYWEVLRQISVSTEVAGLQLVCLIPLELITFFTQPLDALVLPAILPANEFSFLTQRYHELIENLDAIDGNTPTIQPFPTAIRLLRQLKFALTQGDLTKDSRVITISLTGNFIPQDTISITLSYGNAAAPFTITTKLVPPPIPGLSDAQSKPQYLDILRQARDSSNYTLLGTNIQMPPDIVYSQLLSITVSAETTPKWQINIKPSLPTTSLAPQTLEQIQDFVNGLTQTVQVSELTATPLSLFSASASANVNGVNWPLIVQQPFPQQFDQLKPFTCSTDSLPVAWTQQELAAVEALYRHVIANRISYSRAVWQSLTRDEWAMLLEGYSVQVTNLDPNANAKNAESVLEIPLLNCVANQLLGFEGNLAVFPLTLPIREVQEDGTPVEDGLTHANLTQALLDANMRSFRSIPSVITLPTHGMLGEAVLGMCNSCEKIDLTRFWNWQDSPTSSNAPAISPVSFGSYGDGATAGNQTPQGTPGGTVPASMITINNGSGNLPPSILGSIVPSADKMVSPDTGTNPTVQALQALMSQTESRAADQAKNAMQTSADQSKTAMQNSKELTEKAMDVFKDLATTAAKVAPAAAAVAG